MVYAVGNFIYRYKLDAWVEMLIFLQLKHRVNSSEILSICKVNRLPYLVAVPLLNQVPHIFYILNNSRTKLIVTTVYIPSLLYTCMFHLKVL